MPLDIPTVHPKLLDLSRRFYRQTVTIEKSTETRDEWGAVKEQWLPLPDHVDIPARVVSNGPGTGAGGWSGEIYAPDGTYDVDGRTMALRGYFPDIRETHRVMYDGQPYDIQSVEWDAEHVTTRLRTRKVS